jgi:hypothetical protein
VLGTKGRAEVLEFRIDDTKGKRKWQGKKDPKTDMYVIEHQELFNSIREGRPINNGQYMANSTMLAIMGRMCTYTGQTLKWEQCFHSQERLGPSEYAWSDNVPPVTVAIPGKTKLA